jgi:hypothetical protein
LRLFLTSISRIFNFNIVVVDEMGEEKGEATSKLSLADNITTNLHPNLPNYELLYPNEIYNRNRGKPKYINEYATKQNANSQYWVDFNSTSHDACIGEDLVNIDPIRFDSALEVPYKESGRLNSCCVASLSRSELEKPLVLEKTPALFPSAESKDYYDSKSDSFYHYDNDELPLHIANVWAEQSKLQCEDASLDGLQDPNPQKKLRVLEKNASIFVRMGDLELYGSCLDYQDEDAQIIGYRSGASPIITETSESSVFPQTQSHSTSETFCIDSSFEIVQAESYLQETPEVTKRLIFTTKQNSPKAETPSMFNDRTTRATARAASLPNKRKASVPIKLWFDAHLEWPYPSQDEEISLVKNTGLTLQQVRTCFTNLRARRKAKSKL